MKKTYTSAFKAQVVLELLKETKSVNQLATEHGVAPTVLREWKQAALTGMPDLFERRDSVTELKATHARELEERYAEIGRLTTHVNFLKKSSHADPCRTSGPGGTHRGGPAPAHPGRPVGPQSG
jgi:putative transposase